MNAMILNKLKAKDIQTIFWKQICAPCATPLGKKKLGSQESSAQVSSESLSQR